MSKEEIIQYANFPEGSWQKNKYDYVVLPFQDYLDKYYHDFEVKMDIIPEGKLVPHRWVQIQKNCLDKAFQFNDEEFEAYLKNIRCPLPIGKASCMKKKIKEYEEQELVFDTDILRFFSMLECSNFLIKNDIKSIQNWLEIQNWFDPQKDIKQERTIKEILSYRYGNHWLRDKLVDLPWLKIF